ncbi:MAG TPA: MFS transporter, partial [Mycobacteriales bacterium]|nr:MFS transporter [Mycobacteriales bacterium]
MEPPEAGQAGAEQAGAGQAGAGQAAAESLEPGPSEAEPAVPGGEPAVPGGERRGWVGRARRLAIDPAPLRQPDFRRLFIGQGVSFVGYQLTAVAVPVQVYSVSRSSFWVGMLGLIGLAPLVVFGLWGGAVADVVDRRKLLLTSS